MTIKVILHSRTSPITWDLEFDLEEFKSKHVAEIVKYLDDAIAEILKEVQTV